MKTYEQVLKDLKEKYPEAQLSFGYIGNVGRGYGTYADLEWSFFTKVWESNPGFYRNCHSFRVGNTQKKNDTDPEALLPKLIEWLEQKVVPDYGTPCTR